MRIRNKLDRYDARKIQDALKIMRKVRDYNYTCESNPLYRKLDTICRKTEKLLQTELGTEGRCDLQKEFNKNGSV